MIIAAPTSTSQRSGYIRKEKGPDAYPKRALSKAPFLCNTLVSFMNLGDGMNERTLSNR